MIKLRCKRADKHIILMMFKFGQDNKVRKWLLRLLLCSLIIPTSGLYAMSGKQSADNASPPCHQMQDFEQITTQANSGKGCCDTLHQCDDNCDHGCTNCFSSGHFMALVSLPVEPQHSTSAYSLPVFSYHNGLIPTLLLRPPRQLV